MLKLEKTSQGRGVTVCLRTREHFFEPRLLKALALAVALHLGGLLLIQITPFSFTSSYVFPPVHVKADRPTHSISALASTSPDFLEDELSPPKVAFIPPLEFSYKPQESALPPSLATLDPLAFLALEERLWPTWNKPLNIPLEEPRIQMKIAGDLAHYPLLVSDPLLKEMQPIQKLDKPVYVSYAVQLDEMTGELFWVERLQSSGIKAVDQQTEKVIFNLRFAPDSAHIGVTGNIHFVVFIG